MDRVAVFGTVDGGSTPPRGTKANFEITDDESSILSKRTDLDLNY
jgi:hypothetical protein